MMWTTFLLILMAVILAAVFAIGFAWSVKSGQYKDIEEPKYQMLRNED